MAPVLRVTLALALGLGLAGSASGHYIFQQFTGAGTKYDVYEYIRKNTNRNAPVTDLASPDLRCNVGGLSGAGTKTLALRAGDAFAFTLDTPVYHQGPVSLYMSRAPAGAAAYDGAGDWVKIFDWGPDFAGGEATWPLRGSYAGTIPHCMPAGEYLLRIQSLAIHNPGATPQFYVSCAQVNVSGGGGKTPGPTVKIPGAFKATDPGYTANIYNDFHSYTVPGPPVFTC